MPAHFTNATFFTPASTFTPIISLTFAATGSPPTGHCPTGASPFAIAAASPEHPAYPQPPQLLPGSTSSIASSLGSTSTLNFSPEIPRKNPRIIPTAPTTKAAIIIAVTFISLFLQSYTETIPENPIKAIAIRHAVRSTMAVPWKGFGISLYSIFSRTPAISTMAIKKPKAVAKP